MNWYVRASKASYVGSCENSFDPATGDSLIPCFVDVSDFAVKDENSIELSEDEFMTFVSEIPQDVQSAVKGHNISYFFYDGNVFVLYDSNSDVHYFFA